VNKKGTNKRMSWPVFALMTVLFWGVYGVLLHIGRSNMPLGPEAPNASLKAFLLVGVAYFVVAIVGPVIVLLRNGTDWSFNGKGVAWSFFAGTAGAIGAFTLILALGAAAAAKVASPAAAVMPIVFAGAPIVNAFVGMMMHPPEGGLKSIPLPFVLGILMAAGGAFLVARFSPSAQPPKAGAVQAKH
jgi:hypothetical protein